MDSGKRTYLLPIILALIPPVATILFTFITEPSPDKPVLNIERSAISLFGSKGSITLSNIGGGAAATNITVYVDANSKILTVQQLSPINVTLPDYNNSIMARYATYPINDSSFHFNIPRLIQGDAGLVEIKFEFEEPRLFESFDAMAFYDQGSAKARFASTYISPREYAIIGGIISGLLIFFIYMFFIYRKKHFIKVLQNNLLFVRRHLLSNIMTRKSLIDDWKLHFPESQLKPEENGITATVLSVSSFIKNVGDRVRLEDTLQLISAREQRLDSSEIKSINSELLKLIDENIAQIDWDKYT